MEVECVLRGSVGIETVEAFVYSEDGAAWDEQHGVATDEDKAKEYRMKIANVLYTVYNFIAHFFTQSCARFTGRCSYPTM